VYPGCGSPAGHPVIPFGEVVEEPHILKFPLVLSWLSGCDKEQHKDAGQKPGHDFRDHFDSDYC
jgi:hypothetical protein